MLHDHFKANLQNLTDWAQQAQSWPARQKTSRHVRVCCSSSCCCPPSGQNSSCPDEDDLIVVMKNNLLPLAKHNTI